MSETTYLPVSRPGLSHFERKIVIKKNSFHTMFSPDILRIIFGYLDFESKQKKAVLVNKQWFEIIRDNSVLSGHLVLWPPTGNATADEINEILKGNLLFRIHITFPS